jgi:hypothetical protein
VDPVRAGRGGDARVGDGHRVDHPPDGGPGPAVRPPARGEEAYRTAEHALSDLRYQLVVALVTVAFAVFFGFAVRRPWPHVRAWVWSISVLLFLAWDCGVVQSTETVVQRGSPVFPELQAAYRNLLPSWYAWVLGVITFLVVPLLALAAIWLLRSGSSEYYQWADARRYRAKSGADGAGPTLG